MNQFKRHRRLRASKEIRALVQETTIDINKLIYPLFVVEGENIKEEIPSMPGVCHLSLDQLLLELQELRFLGLNKIILFGIPEVKDALGSGAFQKDGIIQRATRFIKENYPNFLVIADTCICQYTTDGHCGLLQDGVIVNDESLEIHNQVALSQAIAGVDIVAPSSMMDGFVASIRATLDNNGFEHTPIMSYGIKYSSAFYGPFRDAAENAPSGGDNRDTYQMNPANRLEAIRELASDIKEGADFIIIKPALAYLDIIRDIRNNSSLPIIAYQVSGEYSMLKAAAINGWIDEQQVVEETFLSMFRAGADAIITYSAKDYAKWLHNNRAT